MSSQDLTPSSALRPRNAPPSMTRRLVGYRSNSEEQRSVPRSFEAAGDRVAARRPGQHTKEASRIPQQASATFSPSSSTRRPSLPTQSTRPRVNQQGRPLGSTGSASSTRSAPSQLPSGSSLPTKDTRPKTTTSRLGGKRSSLTPNSESARNNSRSDSARTNSSGSSFSNSAGRSRNSIDPAANGLHFDRTLTESPTELRTAKAIDITKPTTPTTTVYPELDRYRNMQRQHSGASESGRGLEPMYKLTTHDLPPPTPGYISGTGSQLSAMSGGSPSTRFSESPGPSPYSRDTTPTSVTSQSPGLLAPTRFAPPRLRQAGSPAQTRPPVTRRRAGSMSGGIGASNADPDGLASVRESLTSSSSNSTVRGNEKKITKKKLQAPPPSPPPRKSSSKHTATATAAKVSSNTNKTEAGWRLSRGFSKPVARSPSPAKASSSNTRPIQTLSPRPGPPARPSRDGTPDMQSQLFEPVPVIHSNLSSASLAAGERHGSESHTSSALPRSTTPSSSSQLHVRRPSGQDLAAVTRINSATGAKVATKSESSASRPTRTPSPNVSTFNSRFNFFGRKKTAPTLPPETAPATKKDKSEKTVRKGPAAGTGHEGYGRLGSIRRRSSGALSGTATRGSPVLTSSSQDNFSNRPEFTDPFLRDRMNPVIISGGEIIENRNTSSEFSRSESNTSFISHSRQRSNDSSKFSSEVSTTSNAQEGARNTLWPSAFPKRPPVSSQSRTRRPSESSDDEGIIMKRTLAFRRSQQKLRTSPEQTPMRLPKPINTRGIAPSPLTSVDTTQILTDDSTLELQKEASRGSKLNLPQQSKKLTKRAKSPRKWNLFSRSQNQATAASKESKVESVAATVKVVQTKHVPFYAMMDSSEQEDSGDMDLMDVLRSAEVYDQPSPRSQGGFTGHQRRPSITKTPEPPPSISSSAARSYQSPPPPPQQRPRPRVMSPQKEAPLRQATKISTAPTPAKQSRLPQVGRIPKVVSSRPEQQVSPKSFSRPFNRASFQAPPKRLSNSADRDSSGTGGSSSNPMKVPFLTPELTQQESTVTSGSLEMTPDTIGIGIGKEFLSFSPRKDSVATTTSSSSCCSAIYTMADTTTAIIPSPSAPLAEDEVWDEYNDLIGDVSFKGLASAISLPKTTTTLPIKYRGRGNSKTSVPESPTIIVKAPKESDEPEPAGKVEQRLEVASSVCSCDDDGNDDQQFDIPIIEAASPATPFSVSKFVAGYGDRNDAAEMDPANATKPQEATMTTATSERASASSFRKSGRSSNSSSCSKATSEEEDTPLAQVNLRVGSMTVSKWLTFGHVLFSPAREELMLEGAASRDNNSILVIDGLGNDDWSFYAAETYPGATFFNLSPRAPIPEDRRTSTTFPLSPANHYQIQYNSHLAKFPFARETFTSVVFRFPQAAPESHYRNIISEAHRVLQPGGYIELSILDVDLNNMGNRGRRTIRRLKERIHARNADVSLASTADLMVRLLGRKHFADIKTCRVGVPVASSIARADDATKLTGEGSSSSPSKSKDKGKGKAKAIGEQRSLAEMMNDDSEMADESIAKMVSKVGRWWYSRCYESAAAPVVSGMAGSKKKTIWSDKALMAECEELGTSLKLTVLHARVPEKGIRVASI